jgi:hypothetical protein
MPPPKPKNNTRKHTHKHNTTQIVYVKIPPGRGCGFVQYVQRAAAEAAIAQLQGGDIGGCKVSR